MRQQDMGLCKGGHKSPSTPFTAGRSRTDPRRERKRWEVPPLHTASASIFLLCSKSCRSHLSSILPMASFYSVSPLLLLPMDFLHFEILHFIHEKNQKISYASSLKKIWMVFLFLIQEVFYHGLFGIICEFNEL